MSLIPIVPLTQETLLAWARREVAEHPTAKEDGPYKDGVVTTIEVPNTVARQLAFILQSWFVNGLVDYKPNEARQYLSELAWVGTKGYRDYTEEECLREILDEEEGLVAQYEFDSLDDFLRHFDL